MFFLTGFKASFGFSNVSFIAVTAWNGINNALSRLYINGVFDGARRLPSISFFFLVKIYSTRLLQQ